MLSCARVQLVSARGRLGRFMSAADASSDSNYELLLAGVTDAASFNVEHRCTDLKDDCDVALTTIMPAITVDAMGVALRRALDMSSIAVDALVATAYVAAVNEQSLRTLVTDTLTAPDASAYVRARAGMRRAMASVRPCETLWRLLCVTMTDPQSPAPPRRAPRCHSPRRRFDTCLLLRFLPRSR